jgi:phosphoglycolate phosphatase-like HAD superfamily hydrolase
LTDWNEELLDCPGWAWWAHARRRGLQVWGSAGHCRYTGFTVLVLALDFDGVISDSAPEAFLVALRAYLDFLADSTLSRVSEEVETGPGDLLGRVRGSVTYGAFVEAMPLGNRAEDFAVVLHAIEHNVPLKDQQAYQRHRDLLAPEFLAGFHTRFYERRTAWAESDPEGWTALMAPYPKLPALLRRWSPRVGLAIVTAKDRASVRRLLSSYGIADLFADEFLFDKEMGVSKCAHLEALKTRMDCDYSNITFVDDKVNHLQEAARLGVRCVLSGWGYNGPREAEIARHAGFRVCDLDNLEEQLLPHDP